MQLFKLFFRIFRAAVVLYLVFFLLIDDWNPFHWEFIVWLAWWLFSLFFGVLDAWVSESNDQDLDG